VTVGRHHDATFGPGQQSLVVALEQPGIVEGLPEQFVDQLRHRAATAAVCELDCAVLQIQRADVAAPDGLRIRAHDASATAGAFVNCP
jgi:hypothetical protein